MEISPTTICNLALDFIGAAAIANYDDASDRSPEAAKCRRFWPIVWRAVLRSHPWKCCSRQVELTEATTEPLHTFRYAFPLPADYVRIVSMDRATRRYRVMGKTIQTNVSPATIDYVFLCTDFSKYSADLVRCLYLNLAYELAYSIAQNVEVADRVKTELEKFFLPLARMTDAVEAGFEESDSPTFTDLWETDRSTGFDEAILDS